MKPTEAQIKEFWEWCGFMLEGIPNDVGICWAYPPDGKCRKNLPPIDLNRLFKYAVPNISFGEMKVYLREDNSWVVLLNYVGKNDNDYSGQGETFALALFWAIYEVMK